MKVLENFKENIKFMLTITFLSILIFIISLVITNSIINKTKNILPDKKKIDIKQLGLFENYRENRI